MLLLQQHQQLSSSRRCGRSGSGGGARQSVHTTVALASGSQLWPRQVLLAAREGGSRAAGTRSRRSRLTCWATIPVPDPQQPISTDLGWPTDFAQHYVKGKLIGQGSFGSVYLGIDLHTGKEVAVKVMPKQRGKLTKERTLQKLSKEVGILQKMQVCRNTVRLLGCFESANEVMVVTDLCSGGDLQKLSDDHGALPERAVALIAYEVLQVVEECHRLGILHGDLKPANFVLADRTANPLFSNDINMLFGPPWLLAIDFGCSQYLGPARFAKRTGTPVYMAPEIFDRDYHWEADMWSLGIMLYQLYARRFPYWRTYEECRHAKLDEVALLVAEAPLPMDYGAWGSMSPEGLDFMAGCLERDYTQRMTVTQALNHPWLQQWLPEDDLLALGDSSSGASLESQGTSSEDDAASSQDVLLPHSMQALPPTQQQERLQAVQQAATAAAAQQQQQQQQAPAGQQQPQPQQPQQQLDQQAHRVRRHHVQHPQHEAQQQHALPLQQQQQQRHPQAALSDAQLLHQQPASVSGQQAQQPQVVVVPAHLQAPGAYSSSTGEIVAGGDGTDGAAAPVAQQQHEQPQPQRSSAGVNTQPPAPQAAAAGAVANNVLPGNGGDGGSSAAAAAKKDAADAAAAAVPQQASSGQVQQQ